MRNCDDDILTTSATARIMDRSESAVRRASDLGLLPVQRTSNGTRLFRRRDVVYFPSDVLVYIPSGATSKEATLNALDALRSAASWTSTSAAAPRGRNISLPPMGQPPREKGPIEFPPSGG